MRKTIILAFMILTTAFSMAGQNRTSYFVPNSTQSHNLNPSFVPEQGYVGFPVLSNIDIDLRSNLGLSNFFYGLPDGSMGLFLNSAVSSEEFLGNLRNYNSLDLGLSYSLINAGWFTGKHSFWTVDVGVDANVDTNIPKELFSFLKNGMTADPTNYSIRNLNMTGDVYAYVSVGYSRGLDDLVKGLRVGAKARFLAGFSSFDLNIEQLDLSMSSDLWKVSTLASGRVSSGLLDLHFDNNGNLDFNNIGMSLSPDRLLSGMGASFDIGAQYTLSEGTILDGLRLSVSVTDLGFISHKADVTTLLESSEEFQFDGIEHINDPNLDINGELDNILDDLTQLIAFKKKDNGGKNQISMLAATLYTGLDYTFLKDKMNVGLLYSARFGKYVTDHELTLAWNYAPSKKFDIALSYSFLQNANSFGWLITFTPKKGIGLFLGSEYTSFKYDKLSSGEFTLGLPSRLFVDFNLGFTISLGGSNPRPDID